MKQNNSIYWIWLAEKFGIASKEFAAFVKKHDSPYEVYSMPEDELEQIEGIGRATKERLACKSLEAAYAIVKHCEKNGIEIIGYSDKKYPARLKTIENPPVVLYCLGNMPAMDSALCIGMVGTRKMSEYGMQTAYKISYELASVGACIVSGMALGIDGICACGALEAGGQTIAVLGCGVSVAYPKEHARLMRYISRSGAVISEYPPLTSPRPENFPVRNRIISGLCQGVVIIEAAKRSGALITASRAIAQGRELFAVPGNVGDTGAAGPNDLIRAGANIVLDAADIIDHYDFLYGSTLKRNRLAAAKRHSEISDGVIKHYGVSASPVRRFVEQTVQKTEPRQKASRDTAQDKVPPREKVADNAQNDRKMKIYGELDAISQRVYDALPEDKAFVPDTVAQAGIDIRDVMTSLTILEIGGLVATVPGGMFKKL